MVQNDIFATKSKNHKYMYIVSSREFRANQRKYFDMAQNGEDIILKSRDCGSFRLIPVDDQDIVTNKSDLTERICQALREVKMIESGQLKAKTIDDLIDEL